jgi:hypothetical protein
MSAFMTTGRDAVGRPRSLGLDAIRFRRLQLQHVSLPLAAD